ncbi:CheR family methyltransferase [Gellertiella hungarica]|uniref:Chemotaxis protein methyltransferase n=1 Tax=Gellertiella hungarica TaxID=1572859 RepID=A0A7W6J773_9HYPH|nr:protein-glutamate O-methyltransferase CheR [Gellertiella hungarica]MBB4066074.1 chemotaxis protein methyltransferase CheR [Gellertiella hungarica]
MSHPAIGQEDFHKFREFFYRKTGILFEDSKRYFVDKRLIERMEATGSDSFRSYFTMLRFQASSEELQALTNAMTVNETYFFRESYQFDCLVNSLLDEVVATKPPKKPVRIWSLPCSTGEEPYSIVIYLLEHWAKLDRFDVEIFASDIDTQVLQAAAKGVFSPRSVQHLPAALLRKYFTRLANGNYKIDEQVSDSIDFSRVNLLDPLDTRHFRDIDVVFCRNLLIYFDDTSRRAAAEIFYNAMSPGGFICLGHSESMSRISDLFRVRKFKDAIVYQKPL